MWLALYFQRRNLEFCQVSSNPIVRIDPLGLVEWTGSQSVFSVVIGDGAARYKFKLTTKCVNGKRGYAEVIAGGFAVGLGLGASATLAKAVTFEDGRTDVDPFVFAGSAKFVNFSYAIGFAGYSYQFVQLGGARLIGGGFQFRYDASIHGGAGISTVVDSSVEDCGWPE